MINKKYFLPIWSINLPIYYGHAIIAPSKYLPNKENDVQNKIEGLLLTLRMGTTETDCALELVLTEEEEKSLISISPNKDVFLLNKPLPISRVKAVYFAEENKKEQIVTIINLSSAFIQRDKVFVARDMEMSDLSNLNFQNLGSTKDWTSEIKKYDQLLGGFALMKLGGESYMNYSEHYFSTLSFFSSAIEEELNKAKKPISTIYHIFFGQSSHKTIFPYLYKNLTEEDIYQIARDEQQQIVKDRITGIIDINSLNKGTYIIAVLYTYGLEEEARRKKVDSLIASNFKSDIKEDLSESISLCYGLNRGYSKFNNMYKVANNESIVKFQLNSKLDYYTIETIYQFAINGVAKSSWFPYLDLWVPKLIPSNKKKSYIILDQTVAEKKSPTVGTKAYLEQLLNSFPQKSVETYFYELFGALVSKVKSDITEEFEERFEEMLIQINNLIAKVQKKDEEIENLIKEQELEKLSVHESPEVYKLKNNNNPIQKDKDRVQETIAYNENIDNEYFQLLAEINAKTKNKDIKKMIASFKDKRGIL